MKRTCTEMAQTFKELQYQSEALQQLSEQVNLQGDLTTAKQAYQDLLEHYRPFREQLWKALWKQYFPKDVGTFHASGNYSKQTIQLPRGFLVQANDPGEFYYKSDDTQAIVRLIRNADNGSWSEQNRPWHSDQIMTTMQMLPDGFIYAIDKDGACVITKLSNDSSSITEQQERIPIPKSVVSIAVFPDRSFLIGKKGSVYYYKRDEQGQYKEQKRWHNQLRDFKDIQLCANGHFVVFSFISKKIVEYSIDEQDALQELDCQRFGGMADMQFLSNGTLICAHTKGYITIWDRDDQTGALRKTPRFFLADDRQELYAIQAYLDGTIITSEKGGSIKCWNTASSGTYVARQLATTSGVADALHLQGTASGDIYATTYDTFTYGLLILHPTEDV